jgi:hypothetical protein
MAEREGLTQAIRGLRPTGHFVVENGNPAVFSNPLIGFDSLPWKRFSNEVI